MRRRNRRRALVLGCGPAGMFATHALWVAGWDITIYSRKGEISPLYGAQYLHSPVPMLTSAPPTRVNVQLDGSWEESTRKVYGPSAQPAQTFADYVTSRQISWDIRAAYSSAWVRYQEFISEAEVTPELLASEMGSGFDMVVSSIWRDSICVAPDRHTFKSQEFWASGDAPELDRWCPISCPPQTVILNGTPDRAWYRVSNVFGHTTAEWPIDRKPPIDNVARVRRPLGTNCDCWPGFVHVGRYGSWAPGVLSHEAYQTTLAAVTGIR